MPDREGRIRPIRTDAATLTPEGVTYILTTMPCYDADKLLKIVNAAASGTNVAAKTCGIRTRVPSIRPSSTRRRTTS